MGIPVWGMGKKLWVWGIPAHSIGHKRKKLDFPKYDNNYLFFQNKQVIY